MHCQRTRRSDLLFHTFGGGRQIARPLLTATDLAPGPRWLNYYCWHVTTVLIAFVAAGYAWLARVGEDTPALAVFLSALCSTLAVISAGVAVRAGIHPLRFPSTTLFAVTALAGWLAVTHERLVAC